METTIKRGIETVLTTIALKDLRSTYVSYKNSSRERSRDGVAYTYEADIKTIDKILDRFDARFEES